ncbi:MULTISPECIES: secretin N-terminal domain-containing protein [unclassified Motilimonas]|uniref:secretin N-terminal domain-containing protein n=1 Tax=unclassified Motilimonas TaxID=2643697 RepID=UPI001E5CB7AB|nr:MULTISPECIES: secretin N-terminal domain-containing protein [unclassified Motilimonas]MCE0558528.1 hypothetical protein [Motilimonas sp. E26]MDO6527415.1 secretin N-terminal domain-containing protein [Motilimonas sp. 1_MG-2023]
MKFKTTCNILLPMTLLWGCVTTTPTINKTIELERDISTESTVLEAQEAAAQQATTSPATQSKIIKPAPLLRASQQLSNTASLVLPTGELTINAEQMSLPAFVNLALGEVLNLNYGVDPDVSESKAKVTLRVNEPVASDRLLGLVEEVLQLNGVSLLDNNGFINVVPNSKSESRAAEFVNDTLAPKLRYGKVVEIVPVYYLALTEASQVAQKLLAPSGGTVLMQLNLNSLVVIAKRSEIEKLYEMLDRLDMPAASGAFLTTIRPAYVPVEDIIPDLVQALKAASIPVTINEGNRGVILYPLSNNSFIIASATKPWLNYAQSWVRQLDKPLPTQSGSDGIYTYFMKNTSAGDVYPVISQVFGDNNSSSSNDTSEQAPTGQRSATGAAREASLSISSINADYKEPSKGKSATGAIVSENYRIVVDDTRNSLIFVGKYQDYKRVLDLLEVIDRRPRQVLLEALILSVEVTDDFEFGTSFKVGTNITRGDRSIQFNGDELRLAGVFNNVDASLTAKLAKGNSKVISNPRLIAMDQESAKINAGTQISVQTGEVDSSNGGDSVSKSYTYIDVGVTLEITPSINESGVVELDIAQEVSEQGAAVGPNPSINRNSIQTKVAVESGQTIYMGGLIRKSEIKETKKVPLLGDIPGIGLLFQNMTEGQKMSEMVMLITPHILYNREDADFYTNQFKAISGWEPVVSE